MHGGAVTVGSGRPRLGLAASLLLHAVALLVLLLGRWEISQPEAPREAPIEVVLLPPALPAPPAPDLPSRSLPPPPPPQLVEAPIAETSTPTPGPERPATGAPAPGPVAQPAPPAPATRPAPKADVMLGGAARPGVAQSPRARSEKPATQAEKDFILAQILPFWLIDYRSPRFSRFEFNGMFVLQADGTLSPPFGKSDPWNPDAMIAGYASLAGREHEPQRVAIESFLNAVRAAQPFRLPPGLSPSDFPRPIPVHFRLGDL